MAEVSSSRRLMMGSIGAAKLLLISAVLLEIGPPPISHQMGV